MLKFAAFATMRGLLVWKIHDADLGLQFCVFDFKGLNLVAHLADYLCESFFNRRGLQYVADNWISRLIFLKTVEFWQSFKLVLRHFYRNNTQSFICRRLAKGLRINASFENAERAVLSFNGNLKMGFCYKVWTCWRMVAWRQAAQHLPPVATVVGAA